MMMIPFVHVLIGHYGGSCFQFHAIARRGLEVMNSHSSLETEEKVPATRRHQINISCFEFAVFIGNMIWFHFLIGNTESFHQRQPHLYQENYCVNSVKINRVLSRRWRGSEVGCSWGKAIAQSIHNEVAQDVSQKYGKVPTLDVIIMGVKEDSQTYVRMKRKACEKVGLKSINVDLPRDVSEENLLDAVLDLNVDPEVHGILVHIPLPPHINEKKIQSAINIEKAEKRAQIEQEESSEKLCMHSRGNCRKKLIEELTAVSNAQETSRQ
jgi:hypothetical protein